MAENSIVTRQGSSVMIDGKVRSSLKPKLRPVEEDPNAQATFVELVQMEKLERLQRYAGAGMTASQMTAAANNFDKVNEEKMLALMVDEVFAAPSADKAMIGAKVATPRLIIEKIRNGNVESLAANNGLYNSVSYLHSQGMPYFDIANELAKRRTVMLREQEAQDAADARQATQDEETHTAAATRAMAIGDRAAFDIAVDKLNSFDPEAAAKLETEFLTIGTVRQTSDPSVVKTLDTKRRQLSYADVVNARGDLSASDYTKYLGLVETYESAEVSIAESWLKGELKLTGDLREIAIDNPMFEKSQLYASLVGKLALAKLNADNAGQNFDAIATAQSLLGTQADEIDEAQFLTLQKNASGLIGILNSQKGAELETDDYVGAIDFLKDIQARLKNGGRIKGYKDQTQRNAIAGQIQRLERAIR